MCAGRSPWLARGVAALVIALAATVSKQASADGAFPDSMQIFVPADAPHRIILATNFGLITSDDDGATWEWSCEPRNDDNTILYQKAASPSQRPSDGGWWQGSRLGAFWPPWPC